MKHKTFKQNEKLFKENRLVNDVEGGDVEVQSETPASHADQRIELRGQVIDEGIEEVERRVKKPRKKERMSVAALEYMDLFTENMRTYQTEFRKDLYTRSRENGGLMKKTLTMRGPKEMIRGTTQRQYNGFMISVAGQLQDEIRKYDEAYRATEEDPGAQAEVEKKMKRVNHYAEEIMRHYDYMVRDLFRAAGSVEGAAEFIDTPNELDKFNRNGRQVMEKLELPGDILAQSMAAESFVVEEIDFDRMQGVCTESARLIQKIVNDEEPLEDADYASVVEMIRGYYKADLEAEDMSSLEKKVRMIENTGVLAAVHAMSPGQQFALGQYIVRTAEPLEASYGIRFLVKAGFLDIGQGKQLLEPLGKDYALDDAEMQEIRETREMIEKMRELTTDGMSKVPHLNRAMEHFTASNGILYEVVFRFAAAGVIMPFVFSMNNPGAWPDIMANPFWMASVGVAGLTADHVTGGIGTGMVSQGIMGLGTPKETPEAREERLLWGNFCDVTGDHPETVELLHTQKDGITLLDAINKKAHTDHDTPADYEFHFSDFPEFMEVPEFEQPERDGATREETERVITKIYGILSSPMRCDKTEHMFAKFDEAEKRRTDPNFRPETTE